MHGALSNNGDDIILKNAMQSHTVNATNPEFLRFSMVNNAAARLQLPGQSQDSSMCKLHFMIMLVGFRAGAAGLLETSFVN